MPSTLAVSGGASTAVLGLYVIRAALERIERHLLRDNSELPRLICQWLDNVYHLLSLVLGIVVLGLIIGSTLTYCVPVYFASTLVNFDAR